MSKWIISKTYERLNIRVTSLEKAVDLLKPLIPMQAAVGATDEIENTISVLRDMMEEEIEKAENKRKVGN